MKGKKTGMTVLTVVLTTLMLGFGLTLPARADTVFKCPSEGPLKQGGNANLDLQVDGVCDVTGTPESPRTSLLFVFRNVNIVGGGKLNFKDGQDIDFYAESILVENKGILQAGSPTTAGAFKSRLTFHLWGKPTDDGIECQSGGATPCGIPAELWDGAFANPGMATHMNMAMKTPPDLPKNAACKSSPETYSDLLPGGDCFYQYEVQDVQDRTNGKKAYFGHKVLAVSFGGTLNLYGAKGAIYQAPGQCDPEVPANECNPANTGTSWRRLTGVANGGKTLTLNNPTSSSPKVDWKKDDHVVVTTTDYLASHSEERILAEDAANNQIELTEALTHQHNASVYPIPATVPGGVGPVNDPLVPDVKRAVDTRAAVALLSRNIKIVSEGATPEPDSKVDTFPPTAGNFYGGHTIVRQGFASYQVQGVEFYRLGQGGIIGRYPVHFHMARRTPQQTNPANGPLNYLKDSSIHESMTRWVTIHATQGMYVARNVGFMSIGHGFFLEDATEINNKLYANIGISALAAIKNTQNPRQVPGILADTSTNSFGPSVDAMPYRSDFNHPTVFWIMNGWNDFQYNLAVGAATCGACYWWLPGSDSGPSQYEWWDGYASQQIWDPQGNTNKDTSNVSGAGFTPLKSFVGNSCVAAQTSFQSVGAANACLGVATQNAGGFTAVPSPAPPAPTDINRFNIYYPIITGKHNPTICPGADSSSVQCGITKTNDPQLCDNSTAKGCAATVLDHYTTSFNWAETNFSAVWLRGQWFLVRDSAITDVQTGGLNFVTGGGYTRSDVALGYWSLIRKSLFVGHTQPLDGPNKYALPSGPFNPSSNLKCDGNGNNLCASADNGAVFIESVFPGQRLFNIYDGPAFQEYNAYLDITTTPITDCAPNPNGVCAGSAFPSSRNMGVLHDLTGTEAKKNQCYLPNAAIAWKQPNGFYYPPAFNSDNLWFDNVEIRHFVVEPFFKTVGYDPFVQNQTEVEKRYCTFNGGEFTANFNDIDRQTVLNDDDGTLTGLLGKSPNGEFKPTISINEDNYFTGPLITPECLSDQGVTPLNPNKRVFTARTSPYQWLSTAITAGCGIQNGTKAPNLLQCLNKDNEVQWGHDCANNRCRGVVLYREDLTKDEIGAAPLPQIRMMGQDTAQRSTLTLNHGSYYIDTTQSCTSQIGGSNPGKCPVCTPAPGPNPPKGSDCRYCKPGTDCWANPADIDPTPWNPSLFVGGETYYVYLIYADKDTKQTYDFYVGPNQGSKYKVEAQLADIRSANYVFTSAGNVDWLKSEYQADTGTVHVAVNLSSQAKAFTNSKANFCQPRSFCMPSGDRCVCQPGTDCHDDAVCSWGPRELDCPVDAGGKTACYAFSITMPTDFVPPPKPLVPDAENKLETLFNLFEVKDDYFKPNSVTFTNKGPNDKAFDSGPACKYATVPSQLAE